MTPIERDWHSVDEMGGETEQRGCDAGACLISEVQGSVVALWSTRRPMTVLQVDRDEWRTHEAALERRGTEKAIAELRRWADEFDADWIANPNADTLDNTALIASTLRVAADRLETEADD